MSNEFTQRLNREGNKALGEFLKAIFHELAEIRKALPKKSEKVEKK